MTDLRSEHVQDFLLPDLGEGLEDAEIVEWHVAVGETVLLNQAVASVETAKAVVEVPSPFAGTVVEVRGRPGETLPVGSVLMRIATGSEGQRDPEHDDPSREPETDVPKLLVGYGATDDPPGRRRRGGHRRPLAKPPARKLAKDLGIDLRTVAPGSGPDGAVTREDLQRVAARQGEASAGGAVAGRNGSDEASTGAVGEKAVPGFRGRRPGEVEQVRGIRKRIIARMERSRRDIPHALCTRDADVTELWRLREVLTEQAAVEGSPVKITPMAIMCRAAVTALRRFPTLNARYDQDAQEIHLLEPINLGIAVDTERGLMVPNIKNAHLLSTREIAACTAELAGRCRDGSAGPRELTGGTFTVDNYGYFGTDNGDPIINAPEAAILGIGTIRQRPWVVDGEVVARRVVTLTLAFDHRVCDGGEAGRFVTYLADLCEDPAKILLHS